MLISLISYEYYFFKQNIEELTQLKEEYNNYVLTLKRALLDYEISTDQDTEDEQISSEKKKVTAPQNAFLVVNREPSYLRKSAVSFSKKHNLAEAVDKLYENKSVQIQQKHTHKKKALSQARRKKNRRSAQRLQTQQIDRSTHMRQDIDIEWPINKHLFWLSYGFGPRKHPNGHWEFHQGIDMASPKGTPVQAAADGVIAEAGVAGGYGNCIVIMHNQKYKTRYGHLSKILVKKGQSVKQGQCIGKVGATGNVRGKNGYHLHFEIIAYNKRINPFYYLP